jgi:ribosomal protein S12 methylthiotransferase accessory factor
MEMKIYSGGGKKVFTEYKGFTVKTDQSEKAGGGGEFPEPFDMFLSSIGSCAGIFVFGFCQSREISTDGVSLIMNMEKDAKSGMIGKISLEIKLPAEFPDKYKDAVIKAADLCYVKRHMLNPPEFNIFTTKQS